MSNNQTELLLVISARLVPVRLKYDCELILLFREGPTVCILVVAILRFERLMVECSNSLILQFVECCIFSTV